MTTNKISIGHQLGTHLWDEVDWQCMTCPWRGERSDMLDLIKRGETLWPCHDTACFTETEDGFISEFDVEDPRNRLCAGYKEYIRKETAK